MKFLDKFKIERKVFDKRTLFAIYKLMNKGVLKRIESIVKEGKESIICAAKGQKENFVAVKIYRTLHCDFKNMWNYLINDPRFKRIKKDRFSIVVAWAKREYKNLKIASKNKVNCPKPIAVYENILVMEFIGKLDAPAPRLVDIRVEEPEKIYGLILEEMEKLAKAKLIHSDLSPFNILMHDKPYLIDFSQAVTSAHPLAKNFLERDCKNINNYFKKLGVKVEEKLFEKLSKKMGLE